MLCKFYVWGLKPFFINHFAQRNRSFVLERLFYLLVLRLSEKIFNLLFNANLIEFKRG